MTFAVVTLLPCAIWGAFLLIMIIYAFCCCQMIDWLDNYMSKQGYRCFLKLGQHVYFESIDWQFWQIKLMCRSCRCCQKPNLTFTGWKKDDWNWVLTCFYALSKSLSYCAGPGVPEQEGYDWDQVLRSATGTGRDCDAGSHDSERMWSYLGWG